MRTITFLSDFGTSDTTVSTVKAKLNRIAGPVSIVDISHDRSNTDIRQASYIFSSSYKHFPEGTVHVVLSNVFHSGAHHLLLGVYAGYYIIAPENDLFSLAFEGNIKEIWNTGNINGSSSVSGWVEKVAEIINVIQDGTDFSQCFSRYQPIGAHFQVIPRLARNGIDSNILYIDRYGNIVVNMTNSQFESLIGERPFSICLPGDEKITAISKHYNEVATGQYLCRFNHSGYLEIAINHGSAAAELALITETTGNLNYQFITINL